MCVVEKKKINTKKYSRFLRNWIEETVSHQVDAFVCVHRWYRAHGRNTRPVRGRRREATDDYQQASVPVAAAPRLAALRRVLRASTPFVLSVSFGSELKCRENLYRVLTSGIRVHGARSWPSKREFLGTFPPPPPLSFLFLFSLSSRCRYVYTHREENISAAHASCILQTILQLLARYKGIIVLSQKSSGASRTGESICSAVFEFADSVVGWYVEICADLVHALRCGLILFIYLLLLLLHLVFTSFFLLKRE